MRNKLIVKGLSAAILAFFVFACSSQTPTQPVEPMVSEIYIPPSEPPEQAVMAFKNGNELYRIGMNEEAITMFSTAIELYPNYHEALHDRGLIYFYTNKFDLAITDFNAAIKIKPNHADYLISRSGAYLGKRNYQEFLDDINTALRLEPDNALALFYRGGYYFQTGNFDRAITDLESAQRLEPELDTRDLIESARQRRGY